MKILCQHQAAVIFAGAVPVAKGVAKAEETISARPGSTRPCRLH